MAVLPEIPEDGTTHVGADRAPRGHRFTNWIVAVVVVLGLVYAGTIAFDLYLTWPLPSGVEEPRPSEARAALGAMKESARVVYMRTGKIPQTMVELDMPNGALDGGEFTANDYVVHGGEAEAWSVACTGVYQTAPRDLKLTSNLINGSTTFNR